MSVRNHPTEPADPFRICQQPHRQGVCRRVSPSVLHKTICLIESPEPVLERLGIDEAGPPELKISIEHPFLVFGALPTGLLLRNILPLGLPSERTQCRVPRGPPTHTYVTHGGFVCRDVVMKTLGDRTALSRCPIAYGEASRQGGGSNHPLLTMVVAWCSLAGLRNGPLSGPFLKFTREHQDNSDRTES
eukprot:gene22192-biopygen7842